MEGTSFMHADRQADDIRTYIYPPLDKRYSFIISTICGPNKDTETKLNLLDWKLH